MDYEKKRKKLIKGIKSTPYLCGGYLLSGFIFMGVANIYMHIVFLIFSIFYIVGGIVIAQNASTLRNRLILLDIKEQLEKKKK